MNKNSKNELSKFYTLGYEIGFKNSLLTLSKIRNNENDENIRNYLDKIIVKLNEEYNKYPLIKQSVIEEIINE